MTPKEQQRKERLKERKAETKALEKLLRQSERLLDPYARKKKPVYNMDL